MTILELLRDSQISPLDREILLSHALGKTREYLFAHREKNLGRGQIRRYESYLKRRQTGEPVAYITKKKEFFGYDFYVDKNVLVPRPETETLVDLALKEIESETHGGNARKICVIDVGTGSGNIIISIAKRVLPAKKTNVAFFGADISEKALRVAKRNAKRHGVSKRIKFVQSNMLAYFLKKKSMIEGASLFIVANLPYVSSEIYKKNSGNLRFEPKTALLSGKNGLRHYHELNKNIKKFFQIANCELPITLICEMSPEQKKSLATDAQRLFSGAKVGFYPDLSGRQRVFEIKI